MVGSARHIRLSPDGLLPAQSGLIPRGTRVDIFQQIFDVFLVLGTLVGVVVIGYMVYNAYKYRDRGERDDVDVPEVGELPTGSTGGRKLFLSFGLSTVIVVSLVLWTYGTLLYVEEKPTVEADDSVDVDVVGYRFGWDFVYPNGHTDDTLRIPRNETVRLNVTSEDVFHTFGVPGLRVKTDSIPGQETTTWLEANETGTYQARCFELCGAGHSYMTADVVVMEPDEYEEWYANTSSSNSSALADADTVATLADADTVAPSATGISQGVVA